MKNLKIVNQVNNKYLWGIYIVENPSFSSLCMSGWIEFCYNEDILLL